jgi:transcription antitermination factor NusG
MVKSLKWYAVYTRPHWEKRVAKRLEDKGIITYCPLNKVMRQWHDRKKMVLEPLFRSYVFVYVDLNDRTQVLQTIGALNFVNWLGRPAPISEKEIEEIRKFLKENSNVTVEGGSFKINDEVNIAAGPFISQKGKIIQIKRSTVKIFLPSLGIALYAEIDKSDIEKHSSI